MKMDVKKMKEDDYEAYVNILLKLIDHRGSFMAQHSLYLF